MFNKVFIDTSAWISYFVPTQPDHQIFKKLFLKAGSNHSLIYTSNDVLDETHTRLRYDLGWPTTQKFIEYFKRSLDSKVLNQLWTNELTQNETFNLAQKYQDHKLSHTDVSSAVLMRKYRISTIFTLDHSHFTALGFHALPSLAKSTP